jgi:PhnB protein
MAAYSASAALRLDIHLTIALIFAFLEAVMAKNPHPGYQRVIPYLGYRDCPKAIDFLRDAFGFEERFRMPMPDGRIGHAEMALGDNVIMLASAWEEAGQLSPLDLGGIHTMIYCLVDDVDAHFRAARTAGGIVIGEPEDQSHGARSYRAVDPEGHRWVFATPTGGAPE